MPSGIKRILFSAILAISAWVFVVPVQSQDLEPRMMSAMPTGGNVVLASYAYSSGNILLDNTLPIEDLRASLNSIVVAYLRSFKMFNSLAKFDVIAPYAFGDYEGAVNNIDSSISRTGFGDPLFRLSMNIVGSGPYNPQNFFKQEQKKFNLGAFVRVRAPLGQYDPTKLINLGANRWATKFGLAGSYKFRKKIILEGHLSTWFFSENKDFFNGNTTSQKPIISFQLHATYVFKPGIWIAVSGGTVRGGETIINDVETGNLQSSSRFGAAFAYRLSKHHGLKIAYTNGLSARYGSDFNTGLLAYQFMWFDK